MRKTKSIANNLITKLAIIFSISLILIFSITYFVSKNEINQIFDAELKKSALVIYEIAKHHHLNSNSRDLEEKLHYKFFNRYDYDIVFQVWNKESLIYNSNNKIVFNNIEKEGFFNVNNDKKRWRNFVYIDQNNQLKIAIFENYKIRKNLILEISTTIFFIIFAFLFITIVLIIKITNKELKPIHNLSNKLTTISLSKFEIIDQEKYPFEIRPLIFSFNQLMLKLQQILENEKRFTNHVAHELSTPLTAIRLQAEILQDNYRKGQLISFNNIITAVDRTDHLINQILILSRIESEIDKRNFEYCDIDNLLNETIDEFENNLKNRKFTLQKEFDFSLIKTPIKINKTYFKIMINNILDNAIKYGLDENPIKFFVNNNKKYLSIKIINKSEYIKSEDQNKIFTKFFRANKSYQTKHVKGCGLGLNIVKQIVKIHDGEINFENKDSQTSVIIEFKN